MNQPNADPTLRAKTIEDYDAGKTYQVIEGVRPLMPTTLFPTITREDVLQKQVEILRQCLIDTSGVLFNWHCTTKHNADFENCTNPVCQSMREVDKILGFE